MTDVRDMELLRDYSRQGSEDAFAELVQRHVNLVYSVALRKVGVAAQAEEITQAVFILLARKADRLGPDTVLEGWLHETTRLTALSFLRQERRRQWREQQAYMESTLREPAETPNWNQLAPVLDDALAGLGEKDRDALLLRFFKEQSLREVAAGLGVSEAAAQRRVSRAIEKLRRFFAKRGVGVTAGGLASSLPAHSLQAAPTGLAGAATAAALAKGASASGSTLALVKGTLKIMAWTKAKTATVTAAAVILAAGATTVGIQAVYPARGAAYPNIEGAWETTVTFTEPDPVSKPVLLHQVLKISQTNGAYQASVDLIETGQRDYPVSTVAYKRGVVRLRFHTWGYYEGTVNPSGTELQGSYFPRGGQKAEVVWKRTANPRVPAPLLAESDYAPSGTSVLQGLWRGYASVKGIPQRMDLKIAEPTPGNFRAETDELDQGLKHIPTTVSWDNSTVKLVCLGSELEGTLDSNHTEIRVVPPAGAPGPAWIFKRGTPEPEGDFAFASKTDLQGHWHAMVSVEDMKLPLTVHIARLADGKFSAAVDSPEQGLASGSGALATVVRYLPPRVRIEWVWLKCSFEGELREGRLSGVWTGGSGSKPVSFQRTN